MKQHSISFLILFLINFNLFSQDLFSTETIKSNFIDSLNNSNIDTISATIFISGPWVILSAEDSCDNHSSTYFEEYVEWIKNNKIYFKWFNNCRSSIVAILDSSIQFNDYYFNQRQKIFKIQSVENKSIIIVTDTESISILNILNKEINEMNFDFIDNKWVLINDEKNSACSKWVTLIISNIRYINNRYKL